MVKGDKVEKYLNIFKFKKLTKKSISYIPLYL
jgi:hypothetical protein